MTDEAYVAGMGFVLGGILKFKGHKDAPDQVTISTPVDELFVSSTLLFLPELIADTGATLFGPTGAQVTQ
jgi:intracellular multiplication protein IcmD